MTRAVGYGAALYVASAAVLVIALWREQQARHRRAGCRDPKVVDVELHCPDCGVVHLQAPGVTRDQVLRDVARYDREWRARHEVDHMERQFRGAK